MTRILLRNGHVHAPSDPHATAMCVEDGVVVWIGDDEASTSFVDGAHRVLDLAGRLLAPAFVDAHVHLSQTGMAAYSVDLSRAPTMRTALEMLEAHARSAAFPLVLGYNWDDTLWPEARPFDREEVDRAVGGRPAYLARVDAHSGVVSTAFLDACPRLAALEGYDGTGLVSREANVAAREAVFALVPGAAHEDAIARALDDAARAGIAMVHEMGAPGDSPAEDFERIDAVTARRARPEVVRYWGQLDGVDLARELGCLGAAGDLCMDGAIGSRTAAMHKPYADADTSGHLYLDAAQVAAHVLSCTRAGLQAGFHVIGDRAVTEVVDGFRRAAAEIGTPAMVRARHRLEHLEMVGPDDMHTLADLGVTASMQPAFDSAWGGDDALYARRLGAERSRPMNAFASLHRAGVRLAFGSDTPVTPFDPWGGVRAAAWHRTEEERVTVRTAFDAHTRGGWRAAARDEGGVIAVGAPASVAVWELPGGLVPPTSHPRTAAWSTDPGTDVPPLPDLHPDAGLPTCVLTMVHGEVAFEEPGALT